VEILKSQMCSSFIWFFLVVSSCEDIFIDTSACTGGNSQKSAVYIFYMVFSGGELTFENICIDTSGCDLRRSAVEILKSQLYSSFIWCFLAASCLVSTCA